MAATAERAGAGQSYIRENQLFAGRIAGDIPQLPPTTEHNIAVEEALSRYLQPKSEQQPTAFSAATIGHWLEKSEPPVAVFLIAAHKLRTGERDRSEKRHHAGAAAAGAALKVTGFALDALGAVPVVGIVPKAAGGLLAVAEYGVQANDGARQSELFRGGLAWVPEWVSYNNNPDLLTGPEERSVAAWLLAHGLVRLCAGGKVQPDSELLVESVIGSLLYLYTQKIRLGIPVNPNDPPAGFELIQLCRRLNNRQDTATAARQFVEEMEAAWEKQMAAAYTAARPKRPSSEPSQDQLYTMKPQSQQYNRLLRQSPQVISNLVEKTDKQLLEAREKNLSTGGAFGRLMALQMVAWERANLGPKTSEGREFVRLYREIQVRYGVDLTQYLLERLPSLEDGTAALSVQKFAHHVIYDQGFAEPARPDIENALYSAARVWYRQGAEFYTAREYKQKSRSSKYATFETTKYSLPPFSEMTGMKRRIGETLVQAYLYDLIQLGNDGTDSMAKAQHKELRALLPKNAHERTILLHELPPACVSLFEK